MIKSMTGFGSAQMRSSFLGKIQLEIRSLNHRFLEIVFNLPEGFAYLEEEMKQILARKIKRGRVVVNLNITKRPCEKAILHTHLIQEYYRALKKLKQQLSIKEEIGLAVLLGLPGILTLGETKRVGNKVSFALRELLAEALGHLEKHRQKAGAALYRELTSRIGRLKICLARIKRAARRAVKAKAALIESSEERGGFLKNTDISEELTLLEFHLGNFQNRMRQSQPVGKELDFIAQELQREVNTLAAKSFAVRVIADAVEMKSQIEKVREQLQNVE
jgi:uncharacterized protein (TIGR00255 family)